MNRPSIPSPSNESQQCRTIDTRLVKQFHDSRGRKLIIVHNEASWKNNGLVKSVRSSTRHRLVNAEMIWRRARRGGGGGGGEARGINSKRPNAITNLHGATFLICPIAINYFVYRTVATCLSLHLSLSLSTYIYLSFPIFSFSLSFQSCASSRTKIGVGHRETVVVSSILSPFSLPPSFRAHIRAPFRR